MIAMSKLDPGLWVWAAVVFGLYCLLLAVVYRRASSVTRMALTGLDVPEGLALLAGLIGLLHGLFLLTTCPWLGD